MPRVYARDGKAGRRNRYHPVDTGTHATLIIYRNDSAAKGRTSDSRSTLIPYPSLPLRGRAPRIARETRLHKNIPRRTTYVSRKYCLYTVVKLLSKARNTFLVASALYFSRTSSLVLARKKYIFEKFLRYKI